MLRFVGYLFVLGSCVPAHAQSYGINQVLVYPEMPTVQDSLEIRVSLTFSTQQELIARLDSVQDQRLYICLHYCGGLLPSIDVREDTFHLAPLPAGNYQLICQVFEYGPQWDTNGVAIDTCSNLAIYQDSVRFTVDLPNAVHRYPITTAYRIYPNPAINTIRVEGMQAINALELHTIQGQMLRRWQAPQELGGSLSLPALPPGCYLLQLQFPDGRRATERLFIQ